jgi:hypothetical protein
MTPEEVKAQVQKALSCVKIVSDLVIDEDPHSRRI